MRKTATLVAVLSLSVSALALSSCSSGIQDPKPNPNMREALDKLSGPDVGGVDKSLTSQAEQAVASGDYKRASQMYQQLADEHPGKKEYVVPLADSLRRSGSNEAALKALDPYLLKAPDDAEALEVKGLCQMGVGEFPEASKTFDSVMKINPKRWRTLNALGIMFAAKNLQPQAIAYYNAALEVSPENPGVLNNLGLSFAMQKNYDKAIDTMLRARNHVDSNSAQLKHIDLDLALVYALAGRLDDAEATASQHLGKAELYNNMAFYAYISKNSELAKTYLNMALTQDPAYYERAWKNLNAISGDNDSESNASDEDDNSPKAKRVFIPQTTAADPAPPSAPQPPKVVAGKPPVFVAPSEESAPQKVQAATVVNNTAKPVASKEAPAPVPAPAPAATASDTQPAAPAADAAAAPAQADVTIAPADASKKSDGKAGTEDNGPKGFFSNFSGMFSAPATANPNTPQYPGMKAPKNAMSAATPAELAAPAPASAPTPAAPPPPVTPQPDPTPPAPVTPPPPNTPPSGALPFSPPSQ